MANGRNGSRRRRTQYTGAKTQSFYIDAAGVAGGIADYLDSLGEAVQDAIRPAAFAGAEIVYQRVLLNVAGIGRVSGNLAGSIYRAYMRESSVDGKSAYYRVSWNVTKAPHGRLLEHGWVQRYKVYYRDGKWYTRKDAPLDTPIQRPGYAFIRRAHSALPEAQAAMVEELNKRLQALSYYGA